MRYVLIVLFLALGIVNVFLFIDWRTMGIESGWSYTFSSLIGWIIALLSGLVVLILLVKSNLKSGVLKWSIGLVLLLGILGYTFAENPIYYADYQKESIPLNLENHVIAQELNEEIENFEGVVLIARAGCPFCKDAIHQYLIPLHKRGKVKNVAFYMAVGPESAIEDYKRNISEDILFVNKKKEIPQEQALQISGFPTYVYVKDGAIVHQWSNNDFGYVALDWIENGLE